MWWLASCDFFDAVDRADFDAKPAECATERVDRIIQTIGNDRPLRTDQAT
jgi:hypothetical protein